MNTETYLMLSSIATNIIVGVILSRQIKSQKQIIEGYKGLVEATDPIKIVLLQKEEVKKIKDSASNDIAELKTQVQQLANVVAHNIEIMERYENFHKEDVYSLGFNRLTWINTNTPNCGSILELTMKERKETRAQIRGDEFYIQNAQ